METKTKRIQKVVSEGLCTCKWDPRGDYGLEGYQIDEEYSFERKECSEQGKFVRVTSISIEESGFFNHPFGDAMKVSTFNKIFNIDEEY